MRLLALASLVLGLAAGDAGSVAEIAIPGKFYSPPQLNVLVGTTVTWRNTDTATHTVTADAGSFDSGFVPPGGTYERLFSQPGVYAFHCTIHRFMRGVVRVYALVLTGPDHPLAAGARVFLTGRAPAGSSAVVLEQATDKGWRTVQQKTLPADGTFSFRTVAATPTRYRARAGKTASPAVRLQVAPVVTVSVAAGSVAVATHPARPGARAVLQTYDRERFTFVSGTSTKLGAGGAARLQLPSARRAHVRVLVEGTAGWSPGTSRVLLVRSSG